MLWVGFKLNNKVVHLCPETAYMKLFVPGDIVQIIYISEDLNDIVNKMICIGCMPDMNHVFAYMQNKKIPVCRSIQCVETGVIYGSMNEAAKAVGSSVGNMSNHIRYPQAYRQIKGFTFKVVRDDK